MPLPSLVSLFPLGASPFPVAPEREGRGGCTFCVAAWQGGGGSGLSSGEEAQRGDPAVAVTEAAAEVAPGAITGPGLAGLWSSSRSTPLLPAHVSLSPRPTPAEVYLCTSLYPLGLPDSE